MGVAKTISDFVGYFTNPVNGLFKTTGLRAVTAAYMREFVEDIPDSFVNKISDGFYNTAVATGTNTYAVTMVPTPPSLVNGHRFYVKIPNSSSAASTLNPNSLGAKKIYKNPSTQAAAGDLIANQTYEFVYDASLDSSVGGFLIIGAGSSPGGGGSGIGFSSQATAALNFTSLPQFVFAITTITTAKTFTHVNGGSALIYWITVEMSNIVGLTFPANYKMTEDGTRWDTTLKTWTPVVTGWYSGYAVSDGISWNLTMSQDPFAEASGGAGGGVFSQEFGPEFA